MKGHRGPKIGVLLIVGIASTPALADEAMKFWIASAGTTDGSSWIAAEGRIEPDTPDAFRRFLSIDDTYDGQEVYLNSGGGNLAGGLGLGRIIREHKFATRVGRTVPRVEGDTVFSIDAPGQCASACSYAFLGGTQRNAEEGEIGIHQFYKQRAYKEPDALLFSGNDLSDTQKTQAGLVNYVVSMGVDARFLAAASEVTPQEQMRWLTVPEMLEFDVIYDDFTYTNWALEPYKDGLIAAAKTMNGERTATILCRKRDRRLTLFVAQPWGSGDDSDLSYWLNHSMTLFGYEIPAEDVSGRIAGGSLHLEFKLPPAIEVDTEEEAQYGFGAAGSPNSRWLDQKLPYENFNSYARLVMRNCY
jgi:hypothetical protein